jgi:hypothetical protein
MSTEDRNKVGIGLVILRLRETEAQLRVARVRITELEYALEFYATKTNWEPESLTSAGPDVLQIDEGCGWDVAETALHGKTEGIKD